MHFTDCGAVTSLWRYPFSSLGGEQRTALDIGPGGALGDRSHALVETSTGRTINPAEQRWQGAPRILSRLGRSGPELSFDGQTWADPDSAEARAALAALFGTLVEARPYGRGASHRYGLSPLHLVSLQALASLRRLLPQARIDERRFRPNILLDLPNTLDTLPEYALIGQEFQIGSVRLRGVQKAGRCSFTTLEQMGLPLDRSVLQTLLTAFDRDFGLYCEVVTGGTIAMGDRVLLPVPEARRVVIVGAGQAGAAAARALRDEGFDGEIALVGEETRAPYERPPLSKSMAREERSAAVLSVEEAASLNITLSLGDEVLRIDRLARRVETREGQVLGYDRLILATGGAGRRLPGIARGHGRVLGLRTAEDAEALRRQLGAARSVFVLGNGWLGLELAASLRAQGLGVTLFGRQGQVCPRALPPVVAEVVAAWQCEAGVDLRLGTEPAFFEHADHVEARLGAEVLTADLLVVAIGMVPRDGLARQAGLTCRDGVVTTEDGATEDPCVFAVGDVSRQPMAGQSLRVESWHNANEQAARAARAILGLAQPGPALPRFWSEQGGHTLHIAGLPRPEACPTLSEPGYWEFDGFAIGIDQPLRVHRFAQIRPEVAPSTAAPLPPEGARRHPLGPVELAEGAMMRLTVAPLGELVLARSGGHLHAVAERCPHSAASLAEGMISGGRITCPLHFAEFDLRDGTQHQAPRGCPKLATWTVTEAEGQAWIWVQEAPAP